ncbi:FkbM family methyltransferase [Candidatus Marsarchaeota archaeon]|nr:FkbM family methyltransferase [Candidatus Marsarchaeota archaeon]
MINFNAKENVKLFDLIMSKLIAFNFTNVVVLFRTTRNWFSLGLSYLGQNKEFTVKFRDGEVKTYQTPTQVFKDSVAKYLVNSKRVTVVNKRVKFEYKDREIVLAGGVVLCTPLILENFFNEEYRAFNVKGRVVLDIGANIGDTAIYFVLNGAKKVYAVEPYPYQFQLAQENVSLNKLGNKINLINEGCGGKDTLITVDAEVKGVSSIALKKSKKGKKIKIESLRSLIKKCGLENAILKMDCEGYEYDIIFQSSVETLRKFSLIILEYHYGYLNLEKKLRAAGFFVKHTMPIFSSDRQISDYGMLRGIIYAKRL